MCVLITNQVIPGNCLIAAYYVNCYIHMGAHKNYIFTLLSNYCHVNIYKVNMEGI